MLVRMKMERCEAGYLFVLYLSHLARRCIAWRDRRSAEVGASWARLGVRGIN